MSVITSFRAGLAFFTRIPVGSAPLPPTLSGVVAWLPAVGLLVGALAALALLLAGIEVSVVSLVGFVMLVGIIVNNGIVLVDYTNLCRERGMGIYEAVVTAGRSRLRPILMTTLTTILALLPMTFGFGEGASLRSPMAIAVIGGLVTSTVMSLMVIPCVYYVFEKMKRGK